MSAQPPVRGRARRYGLGTSMGGPVSETTAPRRPGPVPAPSDPRGAKRLPLVLPWAVLGLTLYLVERSVGALLAQVQLTSDATYGGIESLASGIGAGVVARTPGRLGPRTRAAPGK